MRDLWFKIALAIFLLAGAQPAASAGDLPLCTSAWGPGEWRPRAEESGAAQSARLKRPACAKEWTILIYMAPTADLAPYALEDLNEMRAPFTRDGQAASSGKTDLLVELATEEEAPARLHLFAGPAFASLAETEASRVASGSAANDPAANLAEFLKWGAREYPARNYFVVVWGHGQGWQGFQLAGGALSISSLNSALTVFQAAVGKPVDVFATDSCFMQTGEIAYELRKNARYIVGSAEAQNFLGLPYRRILYELNTGRFNGERARAGPSAAIDEPPLLAGMLPALTRQSLDPSRGSQGSGSSSAQSLMTASALDSVSLGRDLAPAFLALGGALEAYLREDSLRALDLQRLIKAAAPLPEGVVDAGAFIALTTKLVEEDSGGSASVKKSLAHALAAADAALNKATLTLALGKNLSNAGLSRRGISLWLPSTAREFAAGREALKSSAFYRDTGWLGWLDLLYLP